MTITQQTRNEKAPQPDRASVENQSRKENTPLVGTLTLPVGAGGRPGHALRGGRLAERVGSRREFKTFI